MKLSALKPDTKNANRGTPRGRRLVEHSLRTYGAGRSILIDKHGHIIAGNKTAEGAKAAGIKNVQVVQSDGTKLIAVQRTDLAINDKAARELAIADNRASEVSLDWDPNILAGFEKDLDLEPFWPATELDSLLVDVRPPTEAPEPQLDKASELQQKYGTARGQIWEIGRHRLMCGDSMESWEALLEGAEIKLGLTDPPYGVGVEYGQATKDDGSMVQAVIAKVLPRLRAFPVVLLTSGHRMLWDYPRPDWVLAWVHPAGMGRCPWGFVGFNPILAYGRCPYLATGQGSRPDALVLAAEREGVEGHPTPKPIKVWTWLLERGSANERDCVFDPFCGSGTTLVAAQQLNRTCYAMEIEPKYVAVALQRMADMGLEPKLVKS